MRKKHINDISVNVSGDLPVWPGDPVPELRRVADIEAGAHVTLTKLKMSAHTGTHVDAPAHFLKDGGTIDTLDLEILTGRVWVSPRIEESLITLGVLGHLKIPQEAERVLFHTRNSSFWENNDNTFHKDYTAISPDGAQWLVDRGIKLVGIDYHSVGAFEEPAPVHHILLGAGFILLETINLTGINAGWYELYCLPIKLKGCEGAPARAILIGY